MVISDVRAENGVNQHNYLVYHEGRYWVMWSDGRYVLVSNPNPKERNPLALSISDDGVVFKKTGYLIGGRRICFSYGVYL